MNLPYPAHQPEKQHAVDALVEHIMASDGELELITLGPLTNVAMAYLKEPAIAKKLKKLWIMGGTGYDQAMPRRQPSSTSMSTQRQPTLSCTQASTLFG